jgi:hypothetical protein
VPGSNHVSAKFAGGLIKGVELYLTVTEDVRIGCSSGGILIEHVVDHPLAVLFGEVHEIKWDTDLPGDYLSHKPVFLPLAIPMEGRVGVMPVLHEHSEDVIALPLQKQGGDTGINSS